MSQNYPYQVLRDPRGDIRLLHFEKRLEGESHMLDCFSLTDVSLNESPSYAALSYVWHTSRKTLPILLNGKCVNVGENLYEALQQLRQTNADNKNLPLWADAICINQNDDKEKSAQVSLMNRIYSEAKKTYIWLGTDDEDGHGSGALSQISHLIDLWNEHGRLNGIGHMSSASLDKQDPDPYRAVGEFINSVMKVEKCPNDPMFVDFKLIVKLFKRPWWRRIWVIQEAILSANAVVMVGDHCVPWEYVVELAVVCRARFLRECDLPSPQRHPWYRYALNIWGMITHFSYFWDDLRDNYFDRDYTEEEGVSLSDAIEWTWGTTMSAGPIEATDDRDRVYGLLELLKASDRQKITVDYSEEHHFGKVMLAVASVLLGQQGPQFLLTCEKPELPGTLPSWVPDLRTKKPLAMYDNLYPSQLSHNAYEVSTWYPKEYHVTWEQSVVTLKGLILKRVIEVGECLVEYPGRVESLPDCKDFILELGRMVRNWQNKQNAGVGESQETRLPMMIFWVIYGKLLLQEARLKLKK